MEVRQKMVEEGRQKSKFITLLEFGVAQANGNFRYVLLFRDPSLPVIYKGFWGGRVLTFCRLIPWLNVHYQNQIFTRFCQKCVKIWFCLMKIWTLRILKTSSTVLFQYKSLSRVKCYQWSILTCRSSCRQTSRTCLLFGNLQVFMGWIWWMEKWPVDAIS